MFPVVDTFRVVVCDSIMLGTSTRSAMQILFANSDIAEICGDTAVAKRKIGQACTKKLQRYLSMLQAAERVSAMPRLGGLHDLVGDRAGQKAFKLDEKTRLVFASGHKPEPRKADGGIDWTSVTIVSIEFIGNYHD